MGFNRGNSISALAGLIAGALVIGALPGLASNGDVMYAGRSATPDGVCRAATRPRAGSWATIPSGF